MRPISRQLKKPIPNIPTFKPQQTQQQIQEQQQLALLQRIVRKFYFMHLIAIAMVYTYILIAKKKYKCKESFIILGVYCYMIIWNWVINFILVILGKQTIAVIFNRVIIRFLIMLFFPFGVVFFILQKSVQSKTILALVLYLIIVSFLFIIYQLYGCTLGQPSNPKYIFQHNDLIQQTQKVWDIRKKYNKKIIKQERFDRIDRI